MEEARLYVNAAARPDGLSILRSMISDRLAQGNAPQAINYLAGALINTAFYAHTMNVERQREVDARATGLRKVG